MMLAKYKKQFGEGFFAWSLYVTLGAIDWIMKGRSPLAWPNVWGVIEWLGWSAIAVAIYEVASCQLARELPKLDRLQDVLLLLGFFARWLVGITLFFTIVAGRLYLYALNARPDVNQFIRTLGPRGQVRFAILIALLFTSMGLLTFVCRMIAVLTRKYDTR